MKRIFLLLSLTILSACSLEAVTPTSIIPSPTSLDSSPSPASDLAAICEQKGYSWQVDNTCWFIQEGNETQPTIRIQYPMDLIQSPFAENTIDNFLLGYRNNFLANYESNYQPEFGSWFLEMTPTIYHHSPTVASIRFTRSEYTGGAHPNTYFDSFTFDTASNTVLAFEDLFADGVDPLATIMPIAREKLLAVLAELGMDADTANQFIPSGTDELSDFRNFALTDTDLLIFFEQNQVSPSAAGTQEISIPLSDLASVLREDL